MQPRIDLAALHGRYDLLIIGGGITGAGILNEAARAGARVLLVEQGDFASATSSASSKLVHGGLRYLKEGQWRLTLESVRERNRLMRTRTGLVQRQPFLMPVYRDSKPGRAVLRIGLAIYDLMGGTWRSRSLSAEDAMRAEPALRRDGLLGAVTYDDARTDDAGLVLRLIFEACAAGAQALNYVRAAEVLQHDGRVQGLLLRDLRSGATRQIAADLVINAAGAWSGSLPGAPAGAPALRPLRGSHLVFPLDKLPLRQAVSWLHVRDRRPVFAYPWEGAALVGTTDLDHGEDPARPTMSADEARYLMEALAHQFPQAGLSLADAVSCYSGVRPIVASGKADADPSSESRESANWSSPGWIGITGGKLTTFRVTAREVLRLAAKQVPKLAPRPDHGGDAVAGGRVVARYGAACAVWLLESSWAHDRQDIPGTPYAWGELRWAARQEQVMHLDDLLLRRTRLGLLLPHGAAALLEDVRDICRQELGWDDARWAQERSRYLELWRLNHQVPADQVPPGQAPAGQVPPA